jgi:dolichol-phosphate mannosyltransferase
VHLAVRWIGLKVVQLEFTTAQAVATIIAMTSNFLLNNLFTYRDQRLSGWKVAWGLLSFYLVCGIGTVANVSIATLFSAPINRGGQPVWLVFS